MTTDETGGYDRLSLFFFAGMGLAMVGALTYIASCTISIINN